VSSSSICPTGKTPPACWRSFSIKFGFGKLELIHIKVSLCGGCGWRRGLEGYFFAGRRLDERDECDRFVGNVEIRSLDIGIYSLQYLTHDFVGAWKFDEDFSILLLQTLCSYWILKISSEHFHKI